MDAVAFSVVRARRVRDVYVDRELNVLSGITNYDELSRQMTRIRLDRFKTLAGGVVIPYGIEIERPQSRVTVEFALRWPEVLKSIEQMPPPRRDAHPGYELVDLDREDS